MTIASEITRIQNNIADAYTAASNKGATLPVTQNSNNLATCISSITTGGSPVINSLNVTPTTLAQTITAPSGTDGYSPINVSAVTPSIDANITAGNIKKDVTILGVTGTYEGSGGGGIGIPREVSQAGVYQMPKTSFTFSLPSNATDVDSYAFYYAFNGCTGLTSVDLSSLNMVSGSYAFYYAFYRCTGLTSVDLSGLTSIGQCAFMYAFYGCSALTSIDFQSLTTVSQVASLAYAFQDCTGLTNIYFRALTTTSFGTYKDQFTNMMLNTGTTVTHTIHFPSNMESIISGLDGYPLFGGTSGYVVLAFDLPATS